LREPPETPVSAATATAGQQDSSPSIIVFSLGTHQNWNDLVATGADVIGIDWQFPLAEARKILPAKIGLQGNLSPALLAESTPRVVRAQADRVLAEMQGRPGHIFNLGHGLTPGARLENITALMNAVKAAKNG
jgi:uroporphyrinogen decarboxylase